MSSVSESNQPQTQIEKTYSYDKINKNGSKTTKVVKRKYNVTTNNARNPEIKQRIINLIKSHKEELLKLSDTKVCSKIKSLLTEENLPGSYNFIRKHWNEIKEDKEDKEEVKSQDSD